MKKLLFSFVLILLTFYSRAQLSKTEIGFETGPSMTTLIGLPNGAADETTLFLAGIIGQYNFNNHFAVKTGMLYDKKGYSNQFIVYDGNNYVQPWTQYSQNYPLEYLVIPAFAKVRIGNKIRLFAEGGPWIGYLVSATNSLKRYDETWIYPDIETDDLKSYKRFDYGISIGGGLGVLIKNHLILEVSIRYNRGLANVSAGNSTLQTETTSFQLGIRYRMGE